MNLLLDLIEKLGLEEVLSHSDKQILKREGFL